ncbi:hypothetical protein [Pseudomonas sp. PH1b]|uniref:hypothetical protein n=1 Tax=Pseudomonas sp. PH1b TaxID=1397282 RepID=UPI00046958C6|nr:hypothetical protein [Pseudomonas sp. PH1b]
MKTLMALGLCGLLMSSMALAKEDRRECEAALERLSWATEKDFTGTGHHEHQQAKEARDAGDYKKCADQASKALEHVKQG